MDTKTLVKTDEEITTMRKGCQILASVFAALKPRVVPGAIPTDLDQFVEAQIRTAGCIPAFKDYDSGGPTPFPGSMCFSRNEGIVHGIPTDTPIAQSDVIKIDMGLIHKGYYADMARTFVMPEATEEAHNLALHAKKTFETGLMQVKDGAVLADYARAAQKHAQDHGYSVVRNLVGHGIGRELHMPPQVPNYFAPEFDNFTFRSGMTLAIEPMINIGGSQAIESNDGWTIVTADGSLSAHYENTILITDTGYEILTQA